MTKIEIFKKNGRIVRYRSTGHAGYADHGEDILCAAISTNLQFPLAGMTEILNLVPKFEIDDGFLEVDLRGLDLKGKDCEINILLESMALMLRELKKEYPKYLKLVEKEEN
ncbi:MAG: ribosomal-processing cysteine protease Prp [Fusobacteriaceae bacterium]